VGEQSPSADSASQDRTIFPIPRNQIFGIPAPYVERPQVEPIGRVPIYEGEIWMFTRLADAREALESQDVSADRYDPRFPRIRSYGRSSQHPGERSMMLLDGPEHVAYRRMVSGEFSFKRVQAMVPQLESSVDKVIDEMLEHGSPVDLVEHLSLRVSSSVICELLGVPYADRDHFTSLAKQLFTRGLPEDEFDRARNGLVEYIDAIVHAKADADPGEGLIARLYHERVRTGELSEVRLASFSMLMLLAGFETTANMISLGVLTFLLRPDLRRQVEDDPQLMPAAVLELLRYHAILDDVTVRMVARDTVIAGQQLRTGDGVFASVVAANFDTHAYENPFDIDFHRTNKEHLAFGAGPHQCLGQNLARAELAITYRRIFERIPSLRLAVPPEEVRLKPDSFTHGVSLMPVEW
jgi:pentalenic acid synthase